MATLITTPERDLNQYLAQACEHADVRAGANHEIGWINADGRSPDWLDPKGKQLGCMIQPEGQAALMLMFNADTQDAGFELPSSPQDSRWYLAVYTSRASPQDLSAAGAEELLDNSKPFRLPQRSSAICLARKRIAV